MRDFILPRVPRESIPVTVTLTHIARRERGPSLSAEDLDALTAYCEDEDEECES